MISLVIPAYSAGPNIERTIKSVEGLCDDVVIISTAPFKEDVGELNKLGTVVELPWNHTFLHGFGSMMNEGSRSAKNDWLLLFGVAETFAESFRDVKAVLRDSPFDSVFRCSHANDIHTWKRIWNKQSGSHWSGLIHEEIVGGSDKGLLFRMQDTEKEPEADPVKQEVFRFLKTLAYNAMYHRLLHNPDQLGGADSGWLRFVNGAKESIEGFCLEHKDMLNACMCGDFNQLLKLVEDKVNAGQKAHGVIFDPVGKEQHD